MGGLLQGECYVKIWYQPMSHIDKLRNRIWPDSFLSWIWPRHNPLATKCSEKNGFLYPIHFAQMCPSSIQEVRNTSSILTSNEPGAKVHSAAYLDDINLWPNIDLTFGRSLCKPKVLKLSWPHGEPGELCNWRGGGKVCQQIYETAITADSPWPKTKKEVRQGWPDLIFVFCA